MDRLLKLWYEKQLRSPIQPPPGWVYSGYPFTTAADGSYSFPCLTAGTFIVHLVVGPEWEFTTPGSVKDIVVTGLPDSNRTNVDFGIWYKLK